MSYTDIYNSNAETMANLKIVNQGCADFSQSIQSSRNIQEDIEIAEEYIENEQRKEQQSVVERLLMAEVEQLQEEEELLEVEEPVVMEAIISPGEVFVDIVEDSTDATGILHPCQKCEGIFKSASDLSTHMCQKKTNTAGNAEPIIIELDDDEDISEEIVETTVDDDVSSDESQTDKDGFKVPYEVIKDVSGKEYRKVRTTAVHVPRPKAKFVYNRKDKGPHECPVCKKTLSRLSGLKVHMRRHNGEFPYDCELCKKKFVCNYDLDRHMNTHSRGKIFSSVCDVCHMPFVSKAGMLQHKQKEHKTVEVDDTIAVWVPPIDQNPPKKTTRKRSQKLKTKKNKDNQKKDMVVNIINPPSVQYVLIYPN